MKMPYYRTLTQATSPVVTRPYRAELRKYLVAFGAVNVVLPSPGRRCSITRYWFHELPRRANPAAPDAFVFAKPVCADHHLDLLLDKFMAWNDVETVFLSADAAFAKRLSARGYRVNDMGSDFITHSIRSRFRVKTRHLKAARNLIKHGLRSKSAIGRMLTHTPYCKF